MVLNWPRTGFWAAWTWVAGPVKPKLQAKTPLKLLKHQKPQLGGLGCQHVACWRSVGSVAGFSALQTSNSVIQGVFKLQKAFRPDQLLDLGAKLLEFVEITSAFNRQIEPKTT